MKKIEIRYLPRKDLYRPDEVAEFFSVHRKTPYSWVAKWRELGQENKFVDVPGSGLRIRRQTIVFLIEGTS